MKNTIFLLFFLFASIRIFAQNPIADFDFVVTYNCGWAHVELHNNSINTDSSFWDFYGTGNFTYNANSIIPIGGNVGIDKNYMITLIAKGNNTSDTLTKTYSLIQTRANFNIVPVDTLLFAPLTINFNNQSQIVNGDTLTYLWDFGDGDTSTDENPIHTYLLPGNYDAYLYATTQTNCQLSTANNIKVKDTAQLGEINYITSQCINDSSTCGYEKHYVLSNDTVKVFGYIYENCCGIKTVTIRFSPDTIHIRQFNVGPLCLCSCGFCFAINIPNITQDSVYVAFDGDVVLLVKSTQGIEYPNYINDFNFFPNPSNNNLQLTLPQKAEINIFDIQGQIVLTIPSTSSNANIDISRLNNGMYYIQVKTENNIVTKKFIKQ